jgi:predicted  nucleic acid-binding Zn-ribbon protein
MIKMEQNMDTILERLNDIERKVAKVKNKTAYRDLRDMVGRVDNQITELSKESVTCRQTKRITIRYTEINTNIDQMMYNIEKHITYAHLMPEK